MKSLVDLLVLLLLDCGRKSGAPVSRDVKTLRDRVDHEGDSFITITLPAFCRDFERSLDEGRITPGSFLSFGKKRSGTPEFLQGFLRNVFDSEGILLNVPSLDCVRFVRQICLFGKNLRRPCSRERELEARERYVQCDNDLAAPSGQVHRYFKAAAAILNRSMLLDSSFIAGVRPRHGPGSTVEQILGNQKWRFRRWHKRLEDVGFTYLLYGLASSKLSYEDVLCWPEIVEPEDEAPVRVIFVPKTLRTPRVIAVEPVCMQYAQQGLKDYLVRQLERCRFTSGRINFRNQGVNQALALESSRSGRYATVDMSDASDRVPLSLVVDMFESTPTWLEWILACRTTSARLPLGDQVIPLKKFASMGSALTFPIEAMVFFLSIVVSRIKSAGSFPTARSLHAFSRDVYVYGDDLIFPADEAPSICDDLESLGFRVNRRKSFWTGRFRESCGSDCYDNALVTPVYLRRDLPTSRKDASGVVSSVATANQLEIAGYPMVAAAVRKAVEGVVGKLPHLSSSSPAIGWHKGSDFVPPFRWNDDLQRDEISCWLPTPTKYSDFLEGSPALAKCFRLIGAPMGTISKDHLLSSSRSHGLTLKRGRALPALPEGGG
ncbi:TPA_asm: RNA-directed RNA polymerase [ssRNA phage Zoerhiza.1_31]|uniref:RNA-directed RNA polymerase n=2 Tax=Leviviricetes TaxID=2842243 RepID=A0A8S5L2M0_9VIRU|nr:RNA-directed RNA polymerase [ssRNA phage Zoerhiza.1_31]QDH88514.1 MAG: RNA-dependent RNA polymerase [Leviviridae sp.]DAD51668.1 TPA_asm: RNA-directed RNA polymerase [ssRNA phage Zoerhiza.1_31]